MAIEPYRIGSAQVDLALFSFLAIYNGFAMRCSVSIRSRAAFNRIDSFIDRKTGRVNAGSWIARPGRVFPNRFVIIGNRLPDWKTTAGTAAAPDRDILHKQQDPARAGA